MLTLEFLFILLAITALLLAVLIPDRTPSTNGSFSTLKVSNQPTNGSSFIFNILSTNTDPDIPKLLSGITDGQVVIYFEKGTYNIASNPIPANFRGSLSFVGDTRFSLATSTNLRANIYNQGNTVATGEAPVVNVDGGGLVTVSDSLANGNINFDFSTLVAGDEILTRNETQVSTRDMAETISPVTAVLSRQSWQLGAPLPGAISSAVANTESGTMVAVLPNVKWNLAKDVSITMSNTTKVGGAGGKVGPFEFRGFQIHGNSGTTLVNTPVIVGLNADMIIENCYIRNPVIAVDQSDCIAMSNGTLNLMNSVLSIADTVTVSPLFYSCQAIRANSGADIKIHSCYLAGSNNTALTVQGSLRMDNSAVVNGTLNGTNFKGNFVFVNTLWRDFPNAALSCNLGQVDVFSANKFYNSSIALSAFNSDFYVEGSCYIDTTVNYGCTATANNGNFEVIGASNNALVPYSPSMIGVKTSNNCRLDLIVPRIYTPVVPMVISNSPFSVVISGNVLTELPVGSFVTPSAFSGGYFTAPTGASLGASLRTFQITSSLAAGSDTQIVLDADFVGTFTGLVGLGAAQFLKDVTKFVFDCTIVGANPNISVTSYLSANGYTFAANESTIFQVEEYNGSGAVPISFSFNPTTGLMSIDTTGSAAGLVMVSVSQSD
jgi:hypothetical protein